MFLKGLNENINLKLKKRRLESLKFDFKGVYFGRYAFCDAIYAYFNKFQSLVQKTKKIFRENCFESVVLEIHRKEPVLSLQANKDNECF